MLEFSEGIDLIEFVLFGKVRRSEFRRNCGWTLFQPLNSLPASCLRCTSVETTDTRHVSEKAGVTLALSSLNVYVLKETRQRER